MFSRGRVFTVVAACLVTGIISCGYYGTSSRTAGDIKKITVPYLQNETPEPEIEIEITQQIIDGLITDNTLKVVSEEEADAILEGSIIDYRNVPFTFNKTSPGAELQADQYRLVIGLKVALFKKKENTYLWKDKKISAHGDYYLETSSDQNYEKALEEVYRDLVEGILGATVQDW
ncbi:MAG: hypothetical protein KAX38_00190 [Candidatus Krumholzibacteria bacterium]|nr:hypothetical protein [Candidatus Krumholzibacteria bacterium]